MLEISGMGIVAIAAIDISRIVGDIAHYTVFKQTTLVCVPRGWARSRNDTLSSISSKQFRDSSTVETRRMNTTQNNVKGTWYKYCREAVQQWGTVKKDESGATKGERDSAAYTWRDCAGWLKPGNVMFYTPLTTYAAIVLYSSTQSSSRIISSSYLLHFLDRICCALLCLDTRKFASSFHYSSLCLVACPTTIDRSEPPSFFVLVYLYRTKERVRVHAEVRNLQEDGKRNLPGPDSGVTKPKLATKNTLEEILNYIIITTLSKESRKRKGRKGGKKDRNALCGGPKTHRCRM